MAKNKRPSASKPSSDAGPRIDGALPTRDDILKFVETSSGKVGKVGKREIARAFGIKGSDRIGLKALLTRMAHAGDIAGNRKAVRQKGRLPPVGVLTIVDRDNEGELVAEPVEWDPEDGPRPRILLRAERGRQRGPQVALGPGDRVLARIARLESRAIDGYAHEAETIKKLAPERRRLLGIFRTSERGGGTVFPIERRDLSTWPVRAGNDAGAEDGDLVRYDILRAHGRGMPEAKIAERLGNPQDERKISLIAVHAHGIPDEFPHAVLEEVAHLPALDRKARVDLTGLPLVTIDPIDARDHDDAVHARPDDDPRNPGGHVITVAIADVAHYVRPGSRLDREAELRGNSCYFPDRVVPMLPERISNDLCSLREAELRPCLVVTMTFDQNGNKRRHTFVRALMRSAAKLAYEEAQAAIDGRPSDKCVPLLGPILRPLWAAYACLVRARQTRAPLDLDLPERKIIMGADGHVARIVVPERLDAHRLIEECMIQANVCAAETLEQRRTPCVYRVHDRPSREKLAALRDFLDTVDLSLPKGEGLRPADLNKVLHRARALPVSDLVNEVTLRSQAQAEYTIANIGHFGLNLQRYAHFTSPIRRYADLVVHRALVRALDLGPGGLPAEDEPRLADVAKAISDTERRAMAAERETADRLLAAYMADRVGATFPARISGVTRAGLFVRLRETGADGLVPMSSLGGEYWQWDEKAHAIVGSRSGSVHRLGDTVEVRLVEAVPTAGALRFEMVSEGTVRPRTGQDRGRHSASFHRSRRARR
jgi:ribonuclease R